MPLLVIEKLAPFRRSKIEKRGDAGKAIDMRRIGTGVQQCIKLPVITAHERLKLFLIGETHGIEHVGGIARQRARRTRVQRSGRAAA